MQQKKSDDGDNDNPRTDAGIFNTLMVCVSLLYCLLGAYGIIPSKKEIKGRE